MILAALSFIVGFKAGLFNIGISGQMLAAGFLATSIVGYSDLYAVLAKPLVILIGILAGGALGAFVGFLKYKFNIHEVVSTIMINYIINYLTGFFHQYLFRRYADPLHEDLRQQRPPDLDQRSAGRGEVRYSTGNCVGSSSGLCGQIHL